MELKTRRTEPNEHIADEVEKCSKNGLLDSCKSLITDQVAKI